MPRWDTHRQIGAATIPLDLRSSESGQIHIWMYDDSIASKRRTEETPPDPVMREEEIPRDIGERKRATRKNHSLLAYGKQGAHLRTSTASSLSRQRVNLQCLITYLLAGLIPP